MFLLVSLFFCYSSLLVELIINVPPSRLVKQKLITMSDIVHSQIFLNKDCRAILLPSFLARIKELLESSDEVVIYIILYLLNVYNFNVCKYLFSTMVLSKTFLVEIKGVFPCHTLYYSNTWLYDKYLLTLCKYFMLHLDF